MKRLACVVFDLDGTLTRTNDLIFATFNFVARKYTGKVYTPQQIIAMFGPPEEVAIERIVGPERLKDAMEDFYGYYSDHHAEKAEIHTGVPELLAYLKGEGLLLAVFTGKGRKTALISLELFGVKSYFDMVVTGSDVANHKPSGDGIRNVMKMFQLRPEEVLMVGDSVADVKAARDAGVEVAAVLWDSYAKEQVLGMGVDYAFDSVLAFETWIKSTIRTAIGRTGG